MFWYLFRSPFALLSSLFTKGKGKSRSTTSSCRMAKLTTNSTQVPQRKTATEYSPRLYNLLALFQFLLTFSSSDAFEYGVLFEAVAFIDFDFFIQHTLKHNSAALTGSEALRLRCQVKRDVIRKLFLSF